jgi:hypothetical protein
MLKITSSSSSSSSSNMYTNQCAFVGAPTGEKGAGIPYQRVSKSCQRLESESTDTSVGGKQVVRKTEV